MCVGVCRNVKLSEARVEAVKALLLQEGVRCQLHTHGWGCQHPEIGASGKVLIFPKVEDR